jgi:hypothetical protein
VLGNFHSFREPRRLTLLPAEEPTTVGAKAEDNDKFFSGEPA